MDTTEIIYFSSSVSDVSQLHIVPLDRVKMYDFIQLQLKTISLTNIISLPFGNKIINIIVEYLLYTEFINTNNIVNENCIKSIINETIIKDGSNYNMEKSIIRNGMSFKDIDKLIFMADIITSYDCILFILKTYINNNISDKEDLNFIENKRCIPYFMDEIFEYWIYNIDIKNFNIEMINIFSKLTKEQLLLSFEKITLYEWVDDKNDFDSFLKNISKSDNYDIMNIETKFDIRTKIYLTISVIVMIKNGEKCLQYIPDYSRLLSQQVLRTWLEKYKNNDLSMIEIEGISNPILKISLMQLIKPLVNKFKEIVQDPPIIMSWSTPI